MLVPQLPPYEVDIALAKGHSASSKAVRLMFKTGTLSRTALKSSSSNTGDSWQSSLPMVSNKCLSLHLDSFSLVRDADDILSQDEVDSLARPFQPGLPNITP